MEVAMAAAAADVGWPYWSPVIGWNSDEYGLDGGSPETLECWSSAASETTFSSAAATPVEELMKCTSAKNKEVRLIHLLSAAAEAITTDHNSHELSRVILARLKELIPTPAAAGSGTERLAGHFVAALHRLMDGGSDNRFVRRTAELTSASQLFQDMSPYVNFGHFTANQAILEAAGGQRRVHIVDWNIMDGGQWAPLMQAFVSMKDCPPPSLLKITAVTAGCKSEAAAVRETGQMLAGFAASIGLPFSFGQCRLDRDGCFRPAALKVLKGEGVVFNCALHAPHHNHYTAESVRSFLAGAAVAGARLVTVVEEGGGGGRTPFEGGFLGRFMEELQRYSAIWEALESGFPKQGRAREMVEGLVLGPRIAGAVEAAYRHRREEEMEAETTGGWGEWMAVAGFGRMGLSFFNQWQAKLLIGLFNDGYDVEQDAPNKLVLRWKSRRLVSASVWSAPPPAKVEAYWESEL